MARRIRRDEAGLIETASIGSLGWAAIGLAAATGVIHLTVGVARSRPSLLLAGLGFFGGIGLFLAGYRRETLALAGVGYVVVQILLWLVFQQGEYVPIGVLDKAVQTVLVAVLLFLSRQYDEKPDD